MSAARRATMPTRLSRALPRECLLTGLAILAFVLGWVTPSAATTSDDLLLVSTDGVSFLPDNALPLFDSMGRVVPGDSTTESVWVRNDAPSAGVLRIDLTGVSADDPELAAAFTLGTAVAGASASEGTSVADGIDNGGCIVLHNGHRLAPGERVQIDVTAALSRSLTDRDGALGTVDFKLRASLRDVNASSELQQGDPCDPDEPEVPYPDADPSDDLPGTGAPLGGLAFVSAIGVLGGIMAFWLARRRDRGNHEHPTP